METIISSSDKIKVQGQKYLGKTIWICIKYYLCSYRSHNTEYEFNQNGKPYFMKTMDEGKLWI